MGMGGPRSLACALVALALLAVAAPAAPAVAAKGKHHRVFKFGSRALERWSAPGWYVGGAPYDPLPELLYWDSYS
jgi:hypothetical protein